MIKTTTDADIIKALPPTARRALLTWQWHEAKGLPTYAGAASAPEALDVIRRFGLGRLVIEQNRDRFILNARGRRVARKITAS